MKIHLMEPYRSAFVAQCVKESLIDTVPPDAASLSSAISKCGTPNLRNDVLQLAVLASDISMVWAEVGSVPKERGLPYMRLSGIENLGVVKLIGEYPPEIATIEKTRWKNLCNYDELWKLEKEEIDTFSSLILSQMEARGKPVHWSLFRLLRAVRLGEIKAIPIILSAIPSHLTNEAKGILSIEPNLLHEYELPIIMTLQELRLTTATAIKDGARIAGASLERTNQGIDAARTSNQMYGLVLEELIGENITFPIPSSIRDVIVLRNRSEIDDFRSFLNPFLDAVIAGDEQSFLHLRKSIRDCVKAFKRFPMTRRLASWTGYASLGLGAIEAATGLSGVSIGTGVVAIGLERLANKWKNQSSWLYLTNTGDEKQLKE